MKRLSKNERKRIVRNKIDYLFKLAFKTHDKELARRAISTVRRLSTRFRVRIEKSLKRKFCKHCFTVFNSANNVRVRIKKNLVECFCLNCDKYSRYPFVKEKKLKKSK
jgi:ribonuclease P protein subunit RPR2